MTTIGIVIAIINIVSVIDTLLTIFIVKDGPSATEAWPPARRSRCHKRQSRRDLDKRTLMENANKKLRM